MFRRSVVKFKANADRFVCFIQVNKRIKGFEDINYRQLNPEHKEDVLKIIDQMLIEEKTNYSGFANIDSFGSEMLKVEKVPCENENGVVKVPRLHRKETMKILTVGNQKEEGQIFQVNPFSNWINSYSYDFPQKEVLTVDLITLLRQEGSEDEVSYQFQREDNVIYDSRETNITVDFELSMRAQEKSQKIDKPLSFRNIYSDLSLNWNPS